jgi:hypothetical protein
MANGITQSSSRRVKRKGYFLTGPNAPQATIPPAEGAAVQARWKKVGQWADPGIGVYNINTGETHISNVSVCPGHRDVLGMHNIPGPYDNWRGFAFDPTKGFYPQSSLNKWGVGPGVMEGKYQVAVEAALKAAGLIP